MKTLIAVTVIILVSIPFKIEAGGTGQIEGVAITASNVIPVGYDGKPIQWTEDTPFRITISGHTFESVMDSVAMVEDKKIWHDVGGWYCDTTNWKYIIREWREVEDSVGTDITDYMEPDIPTMPSPKWGDIEGQVPVYVPPNTVEEDSAVACSIKYIDPWELHQRIKRIQRSLDSLKKRQEQALQNIKTAWDDPPDTGEVIEVWEHYWICPTPMPMPCSVKVRYRIYCWEVLDTTWFYDIHCNPQIPIRKILWHIDTLIVCDSTEVK
jgi:hypothetical protein